MSAPIETWRQAKLHPGQDEVVDAIFAAIAAAAPELSPAIKWGHPTWTEGGPLCQVKPTKKHVGLVFWWGAKLADPAGLLTGSGAKMRTARFPTVESVDAAAVGALVHASRRANRELGDPTKTKG